MSNRYLIIFILASVVWVFRPLTSHGENIPGIRLEPDLIAIGASYNGARTTLSGEIPGNAEVLICVSREPQNFEFFKKGHVLGLFWMNVGEVTISNVPDIYMLYLPSAVPESAVTGFALDRQPAIGFDALEKQASISPDEGDKADRFREFVKLKKSNGLYAIHPDAVTYKPSTVNPAMKSFSCALEIPSAMHEGEYQVTAYVRNDQGEYHADSRMLKIKETGLPAMVVSLAFDHGTAYGVLSVIIALAAGLLMGVVFKGEKGSH